MYCLCSTSLCWSCLLQVNAFVAGVRQMVNGIYHQVNLVEITKYRHVEGRLGALHRTRAASVRVSAPFTVRLHLVQLPDSRIEWAANRSRAAREALQLKPVPTYYGWCSDPSREELHKELLCPPLNSLRRYRHGTRTL
jgi:hypothetical protein